MLFSLRRRGRNINKTIQLKLLLNVCSSRNVSVVPMRRRCIGTTSENLFCRFSVNNCQKAVIEDTLIITHNPDYVNRLRVKCEPLLTHDRDIVHTIRNIIAFWYCFFLLFMV